MTDRIVILAGGASSRMKKQSKLNSELSEKELVQANQRNKGLISIDSEGRPLMDYLLYNIFKAGYNEVYIVTGEQNELFKSLYGSKNSGNEFHGLTIHYAIQRIAKERTKPLGTADALYQAMRQYPYLKSNAFVVCNSDNLYSKRALELVRISSMQKSLNALLSYDRDSLKFSEERIARFALMNFDSFGYLKNIVEKPDKNDLKNFQDSSGKLRVSMNIFRFDGGQFYRYLKNCPVNSLRDEKELPTALKNMVEENLNAVVGIPISEHVPDLTSKEDISILKSYVNKINLDNW